MRTWTRATTHKLCGYCGLSIDPGDPIITIRVGSMKRDLIRCAACTDSLPPPNLPAVPVLSRTTKAMKPLAVLIPGVVDKLR